MFAVSAALTLKYPNSLPGLQSDLRAHFIHSFMRYTCPDYTMLHHLNVASILIDV
jgi:hypothetical protein